MQIKKEKLPKILATSVIRSSNKGDSHGGLYEIDLENEKIKSILQWDDKSISWTGRGGERGLRGICTYNNCYYIAASSAIYKLDNKYNIIGKLENEYLCFCHEIYCYEDRLYITSTGYDAVIIYDLIENKFLKSISVKKLFKKGNSSRIFNKLNRSFRIEWFTFYSTMFFDPNIPNQIKPIDTSHINNVFVNKNGIYCSGVNMNYIFFTNHNLDKTSKFQKVKNGTHNCQPHKDSIIMNLTKENKIVYYNDYEKIEWDIPAIEIVENEEIPDDHARSKFGRGLAIFKDRFVISGYSPSSIMVFDLVNKKIIKTINLSKDVRNAIHGIEILKEQ